MFAICFGLKLASKERLLPVFFATLIYLIEMSFAKFSLAVAFSLFYLDLFVCQRISFFLVPISLAIYLPLLFMQQMHVFGGSGITR